MAINCHSKIVVVSLAPAPLSAVRQFNAHRLPLRAVIRCQAEEASTSGSGASPAPTSAPAVEKCPTCGVPRTEMSFGCDGSGRIIGGIGAVPGFKWWPIKAYRPCGKASAAGIAYKRKGQVLDEVLFRNTGEK